MKLQLGDRILWGGSKGRVEFVVGSGDLPPEWASSEEWFREEFGRGFMLNTERAGLVFECDTEDLAFLARG